MIQRWIPCNTTSSQGLPSNSVVSLNLSNDEVSGNVNFDFDDIKSAFSGTIPDRVIDFLEIASFVFAADCSTPRGNGWIESGKTEKWDRHLIFNIAVRDIAFWDQDLIKDTLKELLGFMSDDQYEFYFSKSTKTNQAPPSLGVSISTKLNTDHVTLFSGGLDSITGIIEELEHGIDPILVSHRSTPIISSKQESLKSALESIYNKTITHIPVWVNKSGNLDRESTQRTRAFLFASLGYAVAVAYNLDEIRFYENGIVSLNLPVADEVLRARASRTTHPISLKMLSKLITHIHGQDFKITNPYILKTKIDVIKILKDHSRQDLIQHTTSCATPGIFATRSQRQCGCCSQCIDRRVSIISLGLQDFDPETDYQIDVFIGKRDRGYKKNYATHYARNIVEISQHDEHSFATSFSNELQKAAGSLLTGKRSENIRKLSNMHLDYADKVLKVFKQQISQNMDDVISGNLPTSCLISLLLSQQHAKSSWKRLAERIAEIIKRGIPIACGSVQPNDEPHLQQIIHAIISPEIEEIEREFPFLSWSLSLTKPDWSVDSAKLWIELKYARKKYGIRKITEDIAADITKYGDNGRHVLFLVYDPDHIITDESNFSTDIIQHGFFVEIFR